MMGNSQSGRGGLPREKRLAIERLIRAQLAGDRSWRNVDIARQMGVDVSTVSRYKRRIRGGSAGPSRASGPAASSAERSNDDPDAADAERTVRCGDCGASIPVDQAVCLSCLWQKTVFRRTRHDRRPRRSPKTRHAA